MANHMRVTLEIGPKGKKVVAVAPDWPGLARGATTEQAAIEHSSGGSGHGDQSWRGGAHVRPNRDEVGLLPEW